MDVDTDVGREMLGFQLVSSGAKEFSEAARTSSFLLLIIGSIHYILRFLGFDAFYFVISLILFVISGYAISTKLEKDRAAIFLPMLIFVVWFFVFQARFDLQFLTYFVVSIVTLLLLPMIFSKGESIAAEMAGLIPVLFLFFDVGFVSFMVEKMHWPITSLVGNLVLFMPWWAFLGLLLLPSSENENANMVVGLARIVGFLYIILVIFIPIVPDVGYEKSLLPSIQEFEEAREDVLARLPNNEHPFVSNIACLLQGEYKDPVGCVDRRKEASRLVNQCKNDERVKSNEMTLKECVEKIKEEKKSVGQNLPGSYDPNLLPTKFEFKVDKDFFPYKTVEPARYTANFDYENPRHQQITAKFSCSFIKDKSVLPGKIEYRKGSDIKKVEAWEVKLLDGGSLSVICLPPEVTMAGSYQLSYKADLLGLKSKSYVTRFFVNASDNVQKKKISQKITKIEGSLNQFRETKSAQEPARLLFGFGHTVKDPIIRVNQQNELNNLEMGLSIENIGGGKITAVELYQVYLDNFAGNCLSGSQVTIPAKPSSRIRVSGCSIIGYVQVDDDYIPKTFDAELNYNYQMEHKVGITVGDK